jgi:hypothetical protein
MEIDGTGDGPGDGPADRAASSSGAASAPAAVGRTAYRIVQEGLTNARKHAPDAPVTVSVTGGPGEGLSVLLSNPVAHEGDAPVRDFAPWDSAAEPPPGAGVPGAGQGLVGLAERTAITGGQLEHGPRDGEFRLRAWIPWASRRGPLEAGVPVPGSDST